jgi:hypothetical protein
MYDVITAVRDMVIGLLKIVEDIVDALLELSGHALADRAIKIGVVESAVLRRDRR